MGENLERIPEHIHDHIRRITEQSGLPDTPESVERIAAAWLEKSEIFNEKLGDYRMQSVDEFPPDDGRGALALTYSGSIVAIGPLHGGSGERNARFAAYSSIGLRNDVPSSATHDTAELAAPIRVDDQLEFKSGPVQRTSAIYRIAVSTDQLPAPEENQRLLEATQVIAEEFAEVNKTIVSD